MEAIENNECLATPMVPASSVPAVNAGGFMSIIEKAAALENVDADKLERMMAMQIQWEDRQARKLFDDARARVSGKLCGIKVVKNKKVMYDVDKNDKSKGQYESFRYATLEDIDKLVRPVLDDEKITVSYDTELSTIPGWHTIVCWLSHAGHREPYRIPMPLDTGGGKNNAQAMGSTQMYGMRRALCAALNIITVGEDDDAQGGPITDEQAKEIKDGLKETGLDVAKFLKTRKVECVEEIRTKDFPMALASIAHKRYTNKKEAEKKAAV